MKATILLLAAVGMLSLAPQLGAQISVGDTPEFVFRKQVDNGMGMQSLADLRGKPVLVDFWGTR
jgi:hypothetical protein